MLENINKILWAIATVLIFISAIYFTIKLKFPQFKIITAIKSILKKETTNGISAKDTLFMALASKIGIGSLSGIAIAIFYGGIGTIFWIWVMAFLTSINCFIENILATKYKDYSNNEPKGGPSYYIKKGLNNIKLSKIYSVLAIITYIVCFMTIQNNTTVALINNTFSINKIFLSFFITVLSVIIIKKGIKSISKACNKIVPIMTLIYLIIGLIIILINIEKVPSIFMNIITEALSFKAINGSILYTLIIGIQKGIFATEAGTGTGATISGASTESNSITQGYIGVISTYFISFIITTITAFIIILSPYQNLSLSNINGIEITNFAFSYHFGLTGEVFLIIILSLFAFSTIITTYYYGESNLLNITNNKKINKIFKIICIIILFIGGIASPNIIWQLINIFLAILTIINLYTIFKLKKEVIKECKTKNK